MTLDQIKTFIAIYRLGSYLKAAEYLYMPQPTLTHRINQLEKELGKSIFIRGKGRIRLTEEGKAFLPYAEKAIEALDQGKRTVENIKNGLMGKLTIGSSVAFSAYVLPEIIDSFIELFPDININVISSTSDEVIKAIKDKKFQLGITKYSINDSQLTFKLINNEHIFLIVAKDHPFARKTSPLSLQSILQEPLILYPEGTQYRETLEFTLNQLNVPYYVKYETSNLELITHLIQINAGVSFFAPSYMRKSLLNKEVKKVMIKNNPLPMRQTFLVYRHNELNSLDHLFIEHITKWTDAAVVG